MVHPKSEVIIANCLHYMKWDMNTNQCLNLNLAKC